MSKMDSFLNRSPLKTSVLERDFVSFSDISAVNLIVGWNLLACLKSLLGHEIGRGLKTVACFHKTGQHSKKFILLRLDILCIIVVNFDK